MQGLSRWKTGRLRTVTKLSWILRALLTVRHLRAERERTILS